MESKAGKPKTERLEYDGCSIIVDKKTGTIEIDPTSAWEWYSYLSADPRPVAEPEDYDHETGEYIYAEHPVLTRTIGDKTYTLSASTHGAIVNGYVVETPTRTQNIIYPLAPAGTPFAQGDVLRGGGLIGSPHNCGNVILKERRGKDQDNFHGTLARVNTYPVLVDNERGIMVFAYTESQIPTNMDTTMPHSITFVSYKLNDDGSFTTSHQIFNMAAVENPTDAVEMKSKAIYTNEAFHPYFDIRESVPIAVKIKQRTWNFLDEVQAKGQSMLQAVKELRDDPEFPEVKEYMTDDETEIPTVTLVTEEYEVSLQPLRGFDKLRARFGMWSGKFRQFWCLEALVNKDEPFDPRNGEKVKGYTEILPGQSTLSSIKIKATVKKAKAEENRSTPVAVQA